jgi:hypothetical protein
MHSMFEWDDTEAARQHRLNQARQLIRMLSVEIVIQGREEPAHTRAFVSIYESQLVRRALSEANAWRRRYQDVAELADVFEAMERAEAELKPARRRGGRKVAA